MPLVFFLLAFVAMFLWIAGFLLDRGVIKASEPVKFVVFFLMMLTVIAIVIIGIVVQDRKRNAVLSSFFNRLGIKYETSPFSRKFRFTWKNRPLFVDERPIPTFEETYTALVVPLQADLDAGLDIAGGYHLPNRFSFLQGRKTIRSFMETPLIIKARNEQVGNRIAYDSTLLELLKELSAKLVHKEGFFRITDKKVEVLLEEPAHLDEKTLELAVAIAERLEQLRES